MTISSIWAYWQGGVFVWIPSYVQSTVGVIEQVHNLMRHSSASCAAPPADCQGQCPDSDAAAVSVCSRAPTPYHRNLHTAAPLHRGWRERGSKGRSGALWLRVFLNLFHRGGSSCQLTEVQKMTCQETHTLILQPICDRLAVRGRL